MFTCPSCGRKTKKLIDGLCPICYAKRVLPEEKEWYLNINLKQCVICGKFYYKNKAYEPTVENLEKVLKLELSKNRSFELKNLEIIDVKFEQNHHIAYVELVIKIKNVYGRIKRIIAIPVKKFVCKDCMRKKSEYYEAIVQIRGKFDDELLRNIKNLFEKNNIVITKEEEKTEGLDLYVYRVYKLIRVVNKIKRIYNVEVKITRKLHTKDRQTSKEIYKLTVLLRFLK